MVGLQFILRYDCPAPQDLQPHQKLQVIDGLLPILSGADEDRELMLAYAEVIGTWFDMPSQHLQQRLARQTRVATQTDEDEMPPPYADEEPA